MSVLGTIFGGVGGKIIDSLDGLITSDDERLAAEAKIKEIVQNGQEQMRQAVIEQDRERTKRHEADMKSDSWLSKNVRPMSLIYLLAVVSVLAVTDGNVGEFTVGAAYVPLFSNLLMLVFAFYFGSKGFERVTDKVTKMKVETAKPKKKEIDDDFDW